MPNRNYERGYRVERLCCEDLEAEGYRAVRTAGSHGPFDVVAWKPDEVRFIQCKRGLLRPGDIDGILEGLDSSLPHIESVRRELWMRASGRWYKEEAKMGNP